MFAHAPPAALARLDQGTERAAEGPRIAYPIAGSKILVSATDPSVGVIADGGKRPYRCIGDGEAVDSRPYARRRDGVRRRTASRK